MGLGRDASGEKKNGFLRVPRLRLKAASRTTKTPRSDDQPVPGCSTSPRSDRCSGMELGRNASGENKNGLLRVPRLRFKAASRTTKTPPSDVQPAPGRSTLPRSDASVRTRAFLVRLLPKQCQQSLFFRGQSSQLGKKPVINMELTPREMTAETSTPKPENEDKLIQEADESKPKPRPGDLIEIFRIGYEHWAIYVEDDCVVHLAPPSEEFEVGSMTSVFSNRAVVKYSPLEDVLHGCSWKVNNKLDGTYLPLPVDKIIERTKNMINKIVQYSLIDGNCEHFVNDLRYGVPRSQQVEHALMEGAKAAGVVISAVMDRINPKPVTA